MLSRIIVSSLALLSLLFLLLAGCGPSPQTRSNVPLTPPPITPQAVRVGPLSSLVAISTSAAVTVTPASTNTLAIATSTSVTATILVSATPVVSASTSLTNALVITPTPAVFILPTVTPTPPPALVLLPTATATTIATTLPASTPSLALTNTLVVSETTPATTTVPFVELPPPFITISVPLPASYQAGGSFASQTVFTDSTIAQQQGSFTILQAEADNAYGSNQHYTLRTQRAVGETDEINVYQIDQYVAVNYTGGDWMLVRRDQGSNIVRAIQPITDLAILFPRIIDQAALVGQEEIGGISTLHYRADDPSGQAARLVQPLLALTGEIRSLNLEVWLAVPGGYVAAYDFQVELAGARVLDANLNEALADQAVTWTYQLTPTDDAPLIEWPADAPTPDSFPVPGFAPGKFPLPPETSLLSLVGGVPDLVSTLQPQEVDSFYRSELYLLGWSVEGEGGLLRCSNEGTSFQLLITADTASNGSRISILPDE